MSKRVLLVEDELDNQAVICQIIEFMMGHPKPLIAADGHEAMQLAYEHKPDIILMDLTIPKMSGWEVTRSLKSDAVFKQTPILALTAHAMRGDRERALEAGCDDYYAKPIEIDTFVAFLTPYMHAPAAEPPVETKQPPDAPASPGETGVPS